MLEKGFYSRYLDRFLTHFERERILTLVFEEAMSDGDDARGALSAFLDVPVAGFPSSVGRVNASTVPRFGSLSNVAVMTGRRLRKTRLDTVVDLGGRLGMRRALNKGSPLPRIDDDLRAALSERYVDEFDQLDRRFGIDVSSWRG